MVFFIFNFNFRPLSDEELDALFPPGYKILPPPTGYIPIRTPGRKLLATPTPIGATGTPMGFMMQGTPERPGLADKGTFRIYSSCIVK